MEINKVKFIRNIFLISVLLSDISAHSQNGYSMGKFKHLTRDSLIQIGAHKVQESLFTSNFKKNNFDKITVFANDNSILVSFLNPIKYIPLNSVYYYDISIDIISGSISYGPLSNPDDIEASKANISFFSPTKETDKNIEFVLNAINNSKTVGKVGDKKTFIKELDGPFIIREKDKYYEIEKSCETYWSQYAIHKVSGKIMNQEHEHLIPNPEGNKLEEKDKYIEIKE